MRRGTRRTLWLSLFWVLTAASAGAADLESLEPFRRGPWLSVALRATGLLDDRTRSTIESGLPGTCSYDIVLQTESGRDVARRVVEFTLTLDLWADRYRLRGPDGEREFLSLAAADSAWASLPAVSIAQLSDLRDDISYRVALAISVQPLGQAERGRISRYVSKTSGDRREEFALDIGALFRRWFGGARPAPREETEGDTFRIRDLPERP